MTNYPNKSRLVNLGSNKYETRDSFYETLEKAGHLYVARIIDRTKRCLCVALINDRYNEPDPDCKICDQLGFLYTDKPILGYKAYEAGKEQSGTPQRMLSDTMIFYTVFDAFTDRRQAQFSRILEVKLSPDGEIIPGNIIEEKYNIKDAVPYRSHGILIYWKIQITTKES